MISHALAAHRSCGTSSRARCTRNSQSPWADMTLVMSPFGRGLFRRRQHPCAPRAATAHARRSANQAAQRSAASLRSPLQTAEKWISGPRIAIRTPEHAILGSRSYRSPWTLSEDLPMRGHADAWLWSLGARKPGVQLERKCRQVLGCTVLGRSISAHGRPRLACCS